MKRHKTKNYMPKYSTKFLSDQRTFFTIQPKTLYMYKYLFYAIEKLFIIFKKTLF